MTTAGAAVRAVIEGFYGPPWSWQARARVMRHSHERGMTHYLYAPKDDPLHRERWREPYPTDELDRFAGLVAEDTLSLGFAVSPGLSIDYTAPEDRRLLAAKIDQIVGLGADLVALLVDDIPVRAGLGRDHAQLATWLHGHLRDRWGDGPTIVLVPTEYTGTELTPYLDTLAGGLPADVLVGWTGPTVVCDRITVDDARRRADSLGGRRPFMWDNYPVNDGLMGDILFLGPLRGRQPGLVEACSGWSANPMVQPVASMLPLASVAAFLRGEDPEQVWAEEAESLGWRVFAEACDGAVPHELVAAVSRAFTAADDDGRWVDVVRAAEDWFGAARRCEAPGLEEEASAWVEQVHREADLAHVALRVIQLTRPVISVRADGRGVAAAPDYDSAVENGMAVAALWSGARRADRQVMGARFRFRPVLSQWGDGAWRFHRHAVEEDANAVDRLVRTALDVLAAASPSVDLRVEVDGVAVAVGDDGRFEAPGASVVTAAVSGATTRVEVPTSPPLTDRRLPKRPG